MMRGDWTKTNVKVYCSANGLNVSGTKTLVDSVNNKLILDYFSSDIIPEREKINAKKVTIDYKRNPEKYKLWKSILEEFINVESIYRCTDASCFLGGDQSYANINQQMGRNQKEK